MEKHRVRDEGDSNLAPPPLVLGVSWGVITFVLGVVLGVVVVVVSGTFIGMAIGPGGGEGKVYYFVSSFCLVLICSRSAVGICA